MIVARERTPPFGRPAILLLLLAPLACNRDDLTSGPDVRALASSSGAAPAVNACDSPPTVQALRELGVVVNEVLLENETGVIDEEGDRVPWVEIFNPGPESVNLGGVPLSDDLVNSRKWEFPCETAAEIPPGGYLVVYLSGKADTLGGLHTSFTIEPTGRRQIVLNGGSDFAFFNADELSPDVSAGRFPDGDRVFRLLGVPTPGAANADPAGLAMEARFLRGDTNEDGEVNAFDAVALLRVLFDRDPPPICLDRLDVNDDGSVTLADATLLDRLVFALESPPPPPFPFVGVDPTPDALDCAP